MHGLKFSHVFLDMDGVIADFVSEALAVHETTLQDFLPKWPKGEWRFDRILCEGCENPEDVFWYKIDAESNHSSNLKHGRGGFWERINPYPWLPELLSVCQSLTDSLSLLSTPSRSPHSYSGKRRWCDKYAPDIKLILTDQKHLLAAPGRLLIDDSDKNCDAFRAAGGSAILFPQHWNSNHDKAPFGPLFYLGQELGRMAREQDCRTERPTNQPCEFCGDASDAPRAIEPTICAKCWNFGARPGMELQTVECDGEITAMEFKTPRKRIVPAACREPMPELPPLPLPSINIKPRSPSAKAQAIAAGIEQVFSSAPATPTDG
jgi:hypothetical protein